MRGTGSWGIDLATQQLGKNVAHACSRAAAPGVDSSTRKRRGPKEKATQIHTNTHKYTHMSGRVGLSTNTWQPGFGAPTAPTNRMPRGTRACGNTRPVASHLAAAQPQLPRLPHTFHQARQRTRLLPRPGATAAPRPPGEAPRCRQACRSQSCVCAYVA